jgi:hypothetical protein
MLAHLKITLYLGSETVWPEKDRQTAFYGKMPQYENKSKPRITTLIEGESGNCSIKFCTNKDKSIYFLLDKKRFLSQNGSITKVSE